MVESRAKFKHSLTTSHAEPLTHAKKPTVEGFNMAGAGRTGVRCCVYILVLPTVLLNSQL